MTTLHEQRIGNLMAQFQEQRARAVELRRKISEISVSATARRKVVKVTVGARGEVRSVEFPTDAYKRLTPAELAQAFMATIEEAREKAMAAFTALMTPELPPGLNVPALIRGEADFVSALKQDPSTPDAVKRYFESVAEQQQEARHG